MKKTVAVFLTLLVLFPPISAKADVGVNVYTSLLNGQNLFYGTAKGANQGNLMLLQSRDGINEFILDRDGNLWASSSLRSRNICNQDGSYCFTPSAGGVDVTNDSWSQNGSEVYATQYVGIGTSDPGYRLDVRTNGGSDYAAVNAINTAGHTSWKSAVYAESNSNVADTGSINNFHMGVWGYANGTATRNYGGMFVAQGATNNIGVIGKVGSNSEWPSGNYSAWFVGAPVYVGSSLGIGTSNPTAFFDVNKGGGGGATWMKLTSALATEGMTFRTDNGFINYIEAPNGGDLHLRSNPGGSGDSLYLSKDGYSWFGGNYTLFNSIGVGGLASVPPADGAYFSGMVGVGTQNPSYQLHSYDDSTNSDAPAVYGAHNVTEGYGVGVYGESKYMGVRGDVSTNYSGSVYGGYFSVYNSGGNGYGVYASGDEYGVYGYGSQYAGYFSGPGYFSGNLGVGSLSNNAKFQVSGRSLLNDGNANLDGQNLNFLANSAQMLIGWNRSAGQGEADFINNRGGGSQGGFSFYDINNAGGQTHLMRIRGDNGYIGIGTANPSYKLHVYSGSGESIAAYIDAASTYGVYAYGNTTAGWFSGNTYGVWGQGSTGVRGESPSGYGVWGNSSSGLGVYGSSNTGWAGYFGGNVYVSGTLRVDTYAAGSGTYVCRNGTTFSTCSSLSKYKEDIEDLNIGLDTVVSLRPVSFDWKNGSGRDIGLIAEEVQAVDDRLVTYEDGDLEGVKYPQLTALLIKAVQEQQVQIDDLKRQIEELKAR